MTNLRYLVIVVITIFTFFTTHRLLQIEKVFNIVLPGVENYIKLDGNISKTKNAYTKITNENLLHWDAKHYYDIAQNRYKDGKHLYLFAFFPLFPWLWSLLHVSPIGIMIVNYLLFLSAVSFLWKHFFKGKHKYLIILLLNLPFIVPFILPYTESVFFVSITLAMIGFAKKKYWLYFIGGFLTAMTRSAITIILLSLVCTEAVFLIRKWDINRALKRVILAALPLIVGTSLVIVYFLSQGASSITTYVDAIQTWGRELSVPAPLHDWSHEGFGLNVATIFYIIPLALFVILNFLMKGSIAKNNILSEHKNDRNEDYLLVFSFIYCIGMFLTILLFLGGSLNGLFRYVLCTPFFFYILIYFLNNISCYTFSQKVFFIIYAAFPALFIIGVAGYSNTWNYSDAGFILFTISIVFLLFYNNIPLKYRHASTIAILILNVIWNTYMFNCFLSDGWIFT